ncbi:AMP-binding protein [Pseudonocardia endophytica]|uniref:Crotonobetaine/carnitine-CoA ligase n=1 Tax=Pseudonocardia endophytica TaxID=401976 RepID=A0A4V2PIN9_PSEEN|nr:AMP-binding protein [Pseudonocardia endophytica]TCK25396.1 crotonobetaine/carnitine-CoA ligase [Pseudonocardia endophytica]
MIGEVLAERAARVGDRPFLLWQGRTTTYAEADRVTNSYARGFADRGIGHGTVVAVMMANRAEFLWTVWGLGKLGAVAVPMNTAARGDQLGYYLRQSGATRVCADAASLEVLAAPLSGTDAVRGVLDVDDLAGFADLPGDPLELDRPVARTDPMLIMYTSGTTGPSKGAVSPQSQGHAVGKQMARHCGYGPDDVLYTCLPLFHANALWFTVYAALWADASVALYPRFSARSFWSEIRESGATEFNALGAMANVVWQIPPSERDRDHRVRTAMVVPTSRALVDGFADRYGITVTSVFAMTENCAVTILGPDDPREKAASAGRVRDDVGVQITAEDGTPLPPGEVGEICVRPNGPGMMMLGYHEMPEATVGAIRDLWFRTGDRGYLDDEGYLFFVDRIKEAIRRRGENISAYELETALCKHPGVHEVAAVAVPADLSEDDVMVYVVRADGHDPSYSELVHYAAENMAYFMVPRYWEFVDELPKTASLKIEKFKLKKDAADRRDELWDRESEGIEVRR